MGGLKSPFWRLHHQNDVELHPKTGVEGTPVVAVTAGAANTDRWTSGSPRLIHAPEVTWPEGSFSTPGLLPVSLQCALSQRGSHVGGPDWQSVHLRCEPSTGRLGRQVSGCPLGRQNSLWRKFKRHGVGGYMANTFCVQEGRES